MKMLRFFLTCTLLALAGNVHADELVIPAVSIEPGSSCEVAVELVNPERAYIMTEFFLSLPEGVSIAKDGDDELLCEPNSDRFDRTHQLVAEQGSDGSYHFLIYSSRNKALKGSSGTLFTMTLQATADLAQGEYEGRIFGQIFSDENKTEYNPADVTFNLNVGSSGDFTLTLVKGWNWVSSYLQEPLPLDQLKEKCSRIVGQEQELIRDPQLGMTGGLTALEAGKAYKVLADEAVTLTFSGQPHDATTSRIELKKGWNWMAYPCGETKGIAVAVANAEAGDAIASQDGTTATYNGNSWTGILTMLIPGQGYLYKSATAKQLVFSF